MNDTLSGSKSYSARELRTAIRVVYWSIAWGLSILLACAGIKFLYPSNMLFNIVALLINVGIGVGVVRAHIIWLNTLDEMQRKIQLESMALTLGVLWIAFGAVLILNAAGILLANIVIFPVLTALVMFAGAIFGMLRHR